MNIKKTLPLIAAVAIAALGACSKPADTVVTKTQESTSGPSGETETKGETKQVGNTLEATSQTKLKTDEGTAKSNVETLIGTVTVYEAGKKIEVMTGENTRHVFDLNEKNVPVSIVGPVAVGAHVRLVNEKNDQSRRLTVSVEKS